MTRPPEAWRALNDLTDDRLVELARERDLAAFEALMRRHNRRLFRVARSVLRDSDAAEDAVQEAYLRAFTRLDTYKPIGRFSAWLVRVAFNEALMIRRATRRDTVSLDALEEGVAFDGDQTLAPLRTSDSYVDSVHARALLEHAIDALPEGFRTVFMLRVVEGLDVKETAECLDLNATTVRTRLHRAHRLLRTELTRRLQGEHASIFDFGAERCDRVVERVFGRLVN